MKWIIMAGLLLVGQSVIPEEVFTVQLSDENIRMYRSEYALPGTGFVDLERLSRVEHMLAKKLEVPARNARFDRNNVVQPEQMGEEFHRTGFESMFFSYFYSTGAKTVKPPTIPVMPQVDAELLQQLSEKVIGRYATFYNPSNKNRSHNISLAAETLDSTVVFPGETFSFNKTVGKRTTAKGYLEAPIIVRGELSEGVGGGICQVSSTLFNAADHAGLQIVQRYSHSRNVPYVPPGRDATVSWYGPDFVFRNSFDQPILIRAKASYGTMRVVLYSSDQIRHNPRHVPGMKRRFIEEVPDRTIHANPS